MFGLLGTERVKVSSTGAIPTGQVLSAGVRQHPDIGAIATRKNREIDVLIWNYHDEDVDAPAAAIDLAITGLPESPRFTPTPGPTVSAAPVPPAPTPLVPMPLVPMPVVLVEHFRVDAHHSNAFTAWKQMGSPQSPSPEQYDQLQSAGQLQLLNSPAWVPMDRGATHLQFTLPRQALSLLRITW
jgi:xylan 1,4-beta-xylosidase